MGALLLPQVLERFRKKYPNIQLDIVEKGGVDLEEMLAKGGLDMALVSLPLKYPSLPCHVFYEDPFLIAVPRAHPMNEVWKEKEFAYGVETESKKEVLCENAEIPECKKG